MQELMAGAIAVIMFPTSFSIPTMVRGFDGPLTKLRTELARRAYGELLVYQVARL